MQIYKGDEIFSDWIGTEKQVVTRMYIVCDDKLELAQTLKHYMNTVKVFDEMGNNILLKGFDVNKALNLK